MLYLDSFRFPSENVEHKYIAKQKRTCYDSFYPFGVLSKNMFESIDFEPITILYGGNGSGKSTALNIIAEKIGSKRSSIFNKSDFYDDYINLCSMCIDNELPDKNEIITSDDVFDYMLNIRNINGKIDEKRSELFSEYMDIKSTGFQMRSLDEYEQLKHVNKIRRKTQSTFIRENVENNIREYSNGESAFKYFMEKIDEHGLYILDEPENSLSPKLQMELVNFLEESVRFFECQLIISTHSPFMLSMKGAKIYNLDENHVNVKSWTELENVRTYYDFFKSHENEF